MRTIIVADARACAFSLTRNIERKARVINYPSDAFDSDLIYRAMCARLCVR